ncbi:DUF4870 domain-containing protein [Pseudomonas aeruginosa]
MFTPDLMLSIYTGLIAGLLATSLNAPRLGVFFGGLAAIGVEAYVVLLEGRYAFGEHLIMHLLVNLILACGVPYILIGISSVYSNAAKYDPAPADTPQIEGRWTAVAAHAAGLLNIFPFVGLFAQAVVWGFTRDGSEKGRAQVIEALQFQASYLMLLGALTPLLHKVVAGYTLLLFAAWLVLTVTGVIQALRKGAFRYPLNIRFIEYYVRARQAYLARQ